MFNGQFELISDYKPAGDQPRAISQLLDGIERDEKYQILLGVTGSGKTFTMANVIQTLNRPTLVLAHNKTLAAQLCAEFREFFPNNAVEYFVSYYDYYQPEAYVAARDVYIEKEADINQEIERLRHRATRSLLIRRDVIIVASVSCIYGLGMPEEYMRGVIPLKKGQILNRGQFLRNLTKIRYDRNDVELLRGRYRVKGDVIDIYPSWEENVLRLEFFGDELERLTMIHPINGNVIEELDDMGIFPATHYVVNEGMTPAMVQIKQELEERLVVLRSEGKDFEAHRLEQRTKYDLEMMAEVGHCKGIENYSRQLAGRAPGEPPGVLLDFFPNDFLTVIDESHVSLPQIKGMFNGDQARKKTLVDYGFRLPSAMDNRPLKFDEFEAKIGHCICVSATPGPYELEKCRRTEAEISQLTELEKTSIWKDYHVVEQIIRPTGLIDPQVVVKPSLYQMDDLMMEVDTVISRKERVLVTALTKKMSEDITDFLSQKGIKVQYLHSDITALDRIDILHDLRIGKYDVLVGVNLLREGLDLPEVSLVVILDADKEGFLRNQRSLIQTMGRAARNVNGRVILYADKMTESMSLAIEETNRRRRIQRAYNEAHGIIPQTIIKRVSDIRDVDREQIKAIAKLAETTPAEALPELIAKLEKDMKKAAQNLEFELAAVLRDQLMTLKNEI
jgi:excinuclease ABC subunit B